MNSLLIRNAQLITPFRLIKRGEVFIEQGRIAFVGAFGEGNPPLGTSRLIDAQGLYVSPGFVDIHVHGGGGGDVMDARVSSLEAICKTHAAGGTTSLLLTTLTAPLSQIEEALGIIESVQAQGVGGARILGTHLEGPYLNPEFAGAQNPEYVQEPKRKDYLPLLDRHPSIHRVTFAPEINGGLELARELRKRGIVAAIGHSGAHYQEVLTAIEAGCTHVTHMFSGMSSMKRINGYRVTGVVESTLLFNELTTELIADGHHLPPSLIRLVLKAKGADRVSLVTDAISATGLGLGEYSLGGLKVRVEQGAPDFFEIEPVGYVAKLSDRSRFAGSVSTMNQLVYYLITFAGVSLLDAVKMATINPAGVIGQYDLGVLRPGARGDVVVFDGQLTIMMTVVGGRIVYRNPEFARISFEEGGGPE